MLKVDGCVGEWGRMGLGIGMPTMFIGMLATWMFIGMPAKLGVGGTSRSGGSNLKSGMANADR